MTTTTTRALALTKLAASGLDEADARALGISWLEPEATAALDPTFRSVPALRLDYHAPSGRPTGFFRVRYLAAPAPRGFEAQLVVGTGPKYVQAPGSPVEAYWPRTIDWARVAGSEEAVVLTEGELKSACAAKHGFPTIGLGGVWSWRSAKRGQAVIPSLTPAGFRWQGRQVHVCFDSDQLVNPDVARAQLALCDELTRLGAHPFVIALPSIGDGKTGLDDFIVARGADAFQALQEKALPFDQSRALLELNAEVVYVRDPGLVVVLADSRRLSPAAFTQHAYANRHYVETSVRADGTTKLTKRPLAPAWLAWEARAELARLTYEPGGARVLGDSLNLWRGWGCRPRAGDVGPWRRLLDFLFDGEPEPRRWFERWCACPLQRPGTKLYTAAVVWGVHNGTGKSLIGYSLGRIYGENFTEIGEEQLHAPFNDWAEMKQLVMGDDVTSGERRQRVAAIDKLKMMITQQRLRINAKFVPAFTVPDRVNYYFTSNHPDAFLLDDTDRRFFVHEVRGAPLEQEFYRAYDAWLRSAAGPPALFDHLLKLNLGDFDPNAPAPLTRAKELMIIDAKSDLGAWAYRLKTEPDQVLRVGESPLEGDLFTNEQLLALYDPERRRGVTANGLGRELKRAGFRYAREGAVIRTVHGPQRLYVVRNAAKWEGASPAVLAAHYNARFAVADLAERRAASAGARRAKY